MNRQERRALRKRQAMMLHPAPGMRETWAAMPKLRDADVIVAVLPDESHVVVKGEALLEEIVRSGVTREDTVIAWHPVPDVDFAAALREVLADQSGRLH